MIRKGMMITAALLTVSMLAACQVPTDPGPVSTVPDNTAEPAEDTDAAAAPDEEKPAADIEIPEGYSLVWADEFDSDTLNEADWNMETHEVGWVNHELQEYVPSEEYAFVKDGELVIRPVKIEKDGLVAYKSGRVNTQNKHDYKYGRFEARLKAPRGKGFLPAFWMMPKDEDYYGQWPKCGEIDIMEVLGDNTKVNYGTLHYGEPHKQSQGMYSLSSGDFSEEYHVFAVEWEPGEIRWYCDGVQYHSENDWFSAVKGEEEKPYPAPFDQPFHVILNVAVGGDWPGDPDSSTVFDERACMYVDYVRIFQKDSYDENVTRPVKEVILRESDESGNLVYNGDFSENEDLGDDENWKFLLFNGGEGKAEIGDNEIIITSTNEGSEEYSVQLVQPQMPMEQGCSYQFSFEAYADEPRTIKPAITAPDVDWIRYLQDTPVDLTGDWQTFTFDIDMNDATDPNGRVEFNMGKQGSTAAVHIRNVKLVKTK